MSDIQAGVAFLVLSAIGVVFAAYIVGICLVLWEAVRKAIARLEVADAPKGSVNRCADGEG